MRSLGLILGGISAAQADRKLAAGEIYAQSAGILPSQAPKNGIYDTDKWADPTNIQWAADDNVAGTTPAPHTSFGPYNCRGYYQSPIDIPRKAVFHNARVSGNKKVPTAGATGRYPIEATDSIHTAYTFLEAANSFAVSKGLQRSVSATGKVKMYVGLLGKCVSNVCLNEQFKLRLGPKNTDGTPLYGQTNDDVVDPVVVYQPLQFHWHFPSEHTIDGIGYPGELHVVHSRLKWFRADDADGINQTLHLNKGAGMFKSSTDENTKAATTDAMEMCSGGANQQGVTGTCGAATTVTTGSVQCTASVAGAKASGKEDNDPQDILVCSPANRAKYMPFLVLGFFLTETCNANEGKLDYNAPVTKSGTTGCQQPATMQQRTTRDLQYNEDFLGDTETTINTVVNTAFFKNDGDGVFRGVNGTQTFDYEAQFGEAMKGPYFRYQGGLTTPPCTEGVEWIVFERALTLTPGTIAKYLGEDQISEFLSSDRQSGWSTAAAATSWTDKGTDQTYSPAPKAIEDLIKEVPVHIRNNRPTVAIHGRNIQYTKLLSVANAGVGDGADIDGTANPAKSTSNRFNYKRPDIMWAATLPNGDRSQCQLAVTQPDFNFQAPINFVGGEVYRGVTPVNRGWLSANTYGYVGPQTGSAARWSLKNTGHGFNVIPQFTYNGKTGYVKTTPNAGGAESDSPIFTKDYADSHPAGAGGYRNLAGAGGVPAGYYIKKMNAAATAIEWFPLLQFHFHFPSEHTVDGYQYAGEMHLVHLSMGISNGLQVPGVMHNVTQASDRRLVSEEKVNGKDSVVIDLTNAPTRALGAAAAPSGAAAGGFDAVSVSGSRATNSNGTDPTVDGWANAVVMGFFLEEDSTIGTDSIMHLFGFNDATGVPYTKDFFWNVDVDSKKFASALFGDMATSGFEVSDSTGAAAASTLSTVVNPVDAQLAGPYTRNYFNYMGGLTTPPCSEGVQFIIFTDPLKVNPSEAKLFRQNYFMNNRPTQPRGSRVILFNDMANAAQPLTGANKMSSTNPFAAPSRTSLTQTFLVGSSASGAMSTALNMFVAMAASMLALVLYM